MATIPEVSVLTSFDSHEPCIINGLWPYEKEFPKVELYAFMQTCLEYLFPERWYRDLPSKPSTLFTLAKAYEDEIPPIHVANVIDSFFGNSEVVALSTFLPELVAPEHSAESWFAAQNALQFLILVSKALRELGHSCSTVEMVGGSLVDGVWRGLEQHEERQTETYVVKTLSPDKAIERLIARLVPVAECATRNGTFLAIELEPGPLFTIGDWRSLLSFCRRLTDGPSAVSTAVGVNLDIAHWAFLSEITHHDVKTEAPVLDRIIHTHISDHAVGHLCDAVPLMFHSIAEFRPWVEMIMQIMGIPSTRVLPYSGYITCELECIYDIAQVQRAVRTVEELIADLVKEKGLSGKRNRTRL